MPLTWQKQLVRIGGSSQIGGIVGGHFDEERSIRVQGRVLYETKRVWKTGSEEKPSRGVDGGHAATVKAVSQHSQQEEAGRGRAIRDF